MENLGDDLQAVCEGSCLGMEVDARVDGRLGARQVQPGLAGDPAKQPGLAVQPATRELRNLKLEVADTPGTRNLVCRLLLEKTNFNHRLGLQYLRDRVARL